MTREGNVAEKGLLKKALKQARLWACHETEREFVYCQLTSLCDSSETRSLANQ